MCRTNGAYSQTDRSEYLSSSRLMNRSSLLEAGKATCCSAAQRSRSLPLGVGGIDPGVHDVDRLSFESMRAPPSAHLRARYRLRRRALSAELFGPFRLLHDPPLRDDADIPRLYDDDLDASAPADTIVSLRIRHSDCHGLVV